MKPVALIVGLLFGAAVGATFAVALDSQPLGFAVGLFGGFGVALALDQRMKRR